MIVIDLGCVDWADETSIEALIDRFKPEALYGFDPAVGHAHRVTYNRCPVILEPKAAWVYDGWIGYVMDGPSSFVSEGFPGANPVECFDFAAFLNEKAPQRMVVKMDVEGAEYRLLEYLHEGGHDALIDLLLIEWHDDEKIGDDLAYRKRKLLANLRCDVESW